MSKTTLMLVLLSGVVAVTCMAQEKTETKVANAPSESVEILTIELEGVDVSLSQPVLVARSKAYLWFPTLLRTEPNTLLALMSTVPDVLTNQPTGVNAWSVDNGLTWSEPTEGPYSDCTSLRLANGDHLLLSNYQYSKTNGMPPGYHRLAKGRRDFSVPEDEVTISNWPRPVRADATHTGLLGFGFTGQTVKLKNGRFLATLYGHFKDAGRYSLVAADSVDGLDWSIRSIIADENCALAGGDGPCEAAMCRLKDDSIMCIFRNGEGVPYGQCWSRDEGRTWTKPIAMADACSVQPSVAVMKDGTVVMSGGRPGIFVWINTDGTGNTWQRVDVQTHHNAFCPQHPITGTCIESDTNARRSTCYTEVVGLDDEHLLVIYDRIPNGWHALPEESQDSNSVWIVRVGVRLTP